MPTSSPTTFAPSCWASVGRLAISLSHSSFVLASASAHISRISSPGFTLNFLQLAHTSSTSLSTCSGPRYATLSQPFSVLPTSSFLAMVPRSMGFLMICRYSGIPRASTLTGSLNGQATGSFMTRWITLRHRLSRRSRSFGLWNWLMPARICSPGAASPPAWLAFSCSRSFFFSRRRRSDSTHGASCASRQAWPFSGSARRASAAAKSARRNWARTFSRNRCRRNCASAEIGAPSPWNASALRNMVSASARKSSSRKYGEPLVRFRLLAITWMSRGFFTFS